MRISDTVSLRIGTAADLPAINAVVEAAVMTWELPERVKRLALSSYRYADHDLEFLELIVATDSDNRILGVAGFEPADPADAPGGRHTLLLHGIYVLPAQHRRGIGRLLLQSVEDAARMRGFDGLLVKAQAGAEAFLISQGMDKLPVSDAGRNYPHRYWKAV